MDERTAEIRKANKELEAEIAERRWVEQQLRQSEDRYRTVFESANDMFVLIDKRGKILNVNQRLTDIGGYERTDLLGKRLTSLSGMMPKKSVAIVVKNFAMRMAGRDIPPYEVEMNRRDGESIVMEISAVAIRKQDKIVADLAVLRDVTARKHAEEGVRAQKELTDRILTTMPNAVAVLDKDLRIVLANQALSETFAVSRAHLEGSPIHEILPAEELKRAIAHAPGNRKDDRRLEFRRLVADRERILVADLFPMNNTETLLVLTDITDERDTQERLYLTDRLASVGQMASGIAHELNNPLTSVIGLSELLNEEEMPDEMREDVEAIHQEAQRAAVIVRNLLAFARKHAPTRQPVQINDVLQDVLKLRNYEHRVHNIEVNLSLQSDLPLVSVDYFQMQQVFLNVIINAENAITDVRETNHHHIKQERGRTRQGIYSRRWPRYCLGEHGPHLRPVLHHQGGRQGYRSGLEHLLRHREPARRQDIRRERAGTRCDIQHRVARLRRKKRKNDYIRCGIENGSRR